MSVPRYLHLSYIDPDPTDSDSSSDERRPRGPRRVVHRIIMSPSLSPSTPVVRKYRGVRQRKWGRWCSEIRDGKTRTRIWIGSFDTAVEAAIAYDQAAVKLRGDKAITNFPQPPNAKEMGVVINPPSPPQPVIKQEQQE